MVASSRKWALLVGTLCLAAWIPISATAAPPGETSPQKKPAAAAAKAAEGEVPVTPSPKARASFLYKGANKLVREANQLADTARKMWADALHRYHRAAKLFSSFKIDLNIGWTLESMGRNTEAAVYIEKFLINSAKAPPHIIKSARGRLKHLRDKLVSVKVSCPVEGATVQINGDDVGQVPISLTTWSRASTSWWCTRRATCPFQRNWI